MGGGRGGCGGGSGGGGVGAGGGGGASGTGATVMTMTMTSLPGASPVGGDGGGVEGVDVFVAPRVTWVRDDVACVLPVALSIAVLR